jgi:DTW domain-containing protein YfiP
MSPTSPTRDTTPCPACRLPNWLCVCALAPRVMVRTPLLLIVHVHERGRTSNTARLLTLAVRNATLVGHGGLPVPPDPATQLPAGVTPVVLFPGRGARPLTPDLIAALPMPPALVVPDGNWKQASRMVKRLPLLATALKVSLPNRNLAGQALRRNQPGHRMSTYEAVVQALAILEGEALAEPLFDFYRRAVDRLLLVRGHRKRGDVYGGVPDPRGPLRREPSGLEAVA